MAPIMQPLSSSFLSSALELRHELLSYELGRRLAAMRPGRYLLETDSHSFDVADALRDGVVGGSLIASVHPQWTRRYDEADEELEGFIENAAYELWFEGHQHEVVIVTHLAGDSFDRRAYVVSPDRAAAEALVVRVCKHSTEVSGQVLVFDGGSFRKDERLFAAIRRAPMDALVLRGTLCEDIVRDLTTFFASRATYEKYKVPFKRGVLLYGPPGNGKTHFLKALIARLDLPCLYVKSLKASYDGHHDSIRRVFQRARAAAPCLMVFEDLETIVTDDNRSFFLNELDGFTENNGVAVLATTNYPERIDPAVIDRPSRFDRKYLFDLPGTEERRLYLEKWSSRLEHEMRPSDAAIEAAVVRTHTFSFAYLKELTLSATVAWVGDPVPGGMDEALASVLELLKEQAQRGRAPGTSRTGRRVGVTPEA